MVSILLMAYVIGSIVWFIMSTISLIKNKKLPAEERKKGYVAKFVISLILFFFALCIIGLAILAMMIVANM